MHDPGRGHLQGWASRKLKKDDGAGPRPETSLRTIGAKVATAARALFSASTLRSALAGVLRRLISPVILTAIFLRAALGALAWAGLGLNDSIAIIAMHHAATWVGLFLSQSIYFDFQAALSSKLLGCPTLSGTLRVPAQCNGAHFNLCERAL